MPETPTRTEFLFMDVWQIFLFYVLMFAATGVFAWQIYRRVLLWKKGRPIRWKPPYFKNFLTFFLGQKKVRHSRKTSGSPLHLLIFYGFLTLFIGTTLLAINTYSPWKFHKGTYYLTYEFVLDVMGLALIAGLIWAWIRRKYNPPRTLTSEITDFHAIYLLLIITITGYIVEAARMNIVPKPFDTSAPVGFVLSKILPDITPPSYLFLWWIHALLVAVFIAVLPRLRLRHLFYGLLSTAGSDSNTSIGRLKTVRFEDIEKTGKIGAETAADYSRWHLMSLDACMECGRCTEVCPAWNVGKTLNPKQVVLSARAAMENDIKVADAITEEALWACTTCNACVDVCPVLIRQVDLIVDARRWLVSEGRLSGTAANMLRQMQATDHAWGGSATEREKWMENENIPLARDLVAKGEPFDVLFWVGCAGATDPGALKTTKAVASLLKKAGVRFACLGKEEKCTGDPARRVGDEFLFQQLAEQNVRTFEQYGVKTIVTSCPHCFNTIKNEYPEFGGSYEVLHHSQFLRKLLDEAKLKPPHFRKGEVTLHDPCYLARTNRESEAPRFVLGGKDKIVEPTNYGDKTLCCGAGGGRMWMEEPPEQRPGVNRAKELATTGASTVALACPFCKIMLDASFAQAGLEKGVRLVDIAEILHEANQ